jgi:DNA topoisomerase VI subunit A
MSRPVEQGRRRVPAGRRGPVSGDQRPGIRQEQRHPRAGRLIEPHTSKRIDTLRPDHRYPFALFVEKEGFYPLLERYRIADRFDVAIMSTKGMSVTAARELMDWLSQQGVTVLVLRDFEKSGFSIVHTLCTTSQRYRFRCARKIIDIGLRLEDVRRWGPLSGVRYYVSSLSAKVRKLAAAVRSH